MEVKIYVPRTVEIPNEYMAALAHRALATLGNNGNDESATRGHLVRQAVRDGLLRDLDELLSDDGSVDLYCDPASEIPLELKHGVVTLAELREALAKAQPHSVMDENDTVKFVEGDGSVKFRHDTVPIRRKSA